MNRLNFEEYGCLIALMAKSRSEDTFTQVGACGMSKENRVIATGYNGLLPKEKMPDWMLLEENREKKSEYFIHAECNLCSQIKRGECQTLCLTLSPCIKCCQIIAAMDIKKIVYLEEYPKCSKFKDFLKFHNIEYYQLSNNNRENINTYLKNQII